jgi:plastocyanin
MQGMVSVANLGEIMLRTSFALLITLTACGGSSSDTPDAARQIDAAAASVMAVTCPATPAASITAKDADMTFMPTAVTINIGQVVQFIMPATHNVAPNTTMSDPGLVVDFRQTKCLTFTRAGTFGFHCVPHGFSGTVTVTAGD